MSEKADFLIIGGAIPVYFPLAYTATYHFDRDLFGEPIQPQT